MPLPGPRASAGAIYVQGIIADLGGAGSTALFAAPEAGFIKEVHVVRSVAAGTGASILTITTVAGVVAPTLTLLTGGAAGDVDSFDLAKEATNNRLAAGEGFSIASGGQFSLAPRGDIVVVMEPY